MAAGERGMEEESEERSCAQPPHQQRASVSERLCAQPPHRSARTKKDRAARLRQTRVRHSNPGLVSQHSRVNREADRGGGEQSSHLP